MNSFKKILINTFFFPNEIQILFLTGIHGFRYIYVFKLKNPTAFQGSVDPLSFFAVTTNQCD